jgi:hypothetical protein
MTTTNPVPATKAAFLAEYEKQLAINHEWAKDPAKLASTMEKVLTTITTDHLAPWHHSGPTVIEIWKRMGFKGRPTLRGLRALPAA